MVFGFGKRSVATPSSDHPDTRGEPTAAPSASVATPPLELVPREMRELHHAIDTFRDEVTWLRERFEKLQNRVTTELREIRREVDSFYDETDE